MVALGRLLGVGASAAGQTDLVKVRELRVDLWWGDLSQRSDRGHADSRVRVVIADDLLGDPDHLFTVTLTPSVCGGGVFFAASSPAVFAAGTFVVAPSPTPGDTAGAMPEENVEIVSPRR
jgi:hypothetical protein